MSAHTAYCHAACHGTTRMGGKRRPATEAIRCRLRANSRPQARMSSDPGNGGFPRPISFAVYRLDRAKIAIAHVVSNIRPAFSGPSGVQQAIRIAESTVATWSHNA